MYICSINSGSNGNCYYIADDDDAVLIDAGISVKETERRFARLGLSFEKVRAIFVSHEHGDHITGVPGLSKKYRIPVYITNDTLTHSHIPIEESLLRSFSEAAPVTVGKLHITSFSKAHDASDPHSFMISLGNMQVGVFTDIGIVCDKLRHYFKQCNAAFLEANYCEEMLANGRYPYHLKRRISGGKGHLSNKQAYELFTTHRCAQLSHLILSHLSSNNNTHTIVSSLFNQVALQTNVVIASRYKETQVMKIEMSNASPLQPFASLSSRSALRTHQKPQLQLSLF